jgi:hypothetical protein
MESKQLDPAILHYNDRNGGRWHRENYRASGSMKKLPEVDAFLSEVLEVCRKHGMSLGHEDHHGSFIVQEYSEENAGWLAAASVYGPFGKS